MYDLDMYQVKAMTLAVYHKDRAIVYPTLGLVEEVGELLDSDINDLDTLVKEMGDVCWYAQALCSDLGIRFQEAYDNATIQPLLSDIQALFKNTVMVAGRVKKIVRGDSDRDGKVIAIRGYVGDIVRRIEGIASVRGVSLGEVCDRNLAKLFDRKDRGVLKGDGDNR